MLKRNKDPDISLDSVRRNGPYEDVGEIRRTGGVGQPELRETLGVGRSGYDEDVQGLAAPGAYVPRKRSNVLELDMGDGVVLYDGGTSLVHHLSPSASLIWQLCSGEADIETLSREVAQELHEEETKVREDIASLVAELDALGLVEDGSALATS